MANVLQTSPPIWIIDTPSATPITTDPTRIYRIKWVIAAAGVVTDNVVVTDAAGNVIFTDFDGPGTASYESNTFTMPPKAGTVIGIAVPTLTRGKVYIYLA